MTTPPPSGAAAAGESAPPTASTDRVRLRRLRDRGTFDRRAIDAILDEGLVAHLGFAVDGQPFVVPTLHARDGDTVYLHGSAASRALRALEDGLPACLTVTLLDGLVLARSVANHSVNYRSVMLLGRARPVEDPQEKTAALRVVVEHVVPGRWDEARAPSENELKETAVLALPIDEYSAKIRTGPPHDDEEDYALDVWAGLLPFAPAPGTPVPDPRLDAAVPVPSYVSGWRRPSPRPRT